MSEPKKCTKGEKTMIRNAIKKGNLLAQQKNKTLDSFIPNADFLAGFYEHVREELLKNYNEEADNFLIPIDTQLLSFTKH